MGLLDFFSKKKKGDEDTDSIADLGLSDLKAGYMVDYDLATYQVEAHNFYDWGKGDKSYEWQLKGIDTTYFLEVEDEDEKEWSLNRKIAFGKLDPQVKESILESGDPPREITLDGVTYYQEEMAGGHFHKDCQPENGREFLRWSYEDDDGSKYLSIEQWGEMEFEAYTGIPVEPYQFSNILPG
jgi:hypothetical protein